MMIFSVSLASGSNDLILAIARHLKACLATKRELTEVTWISKFLSGCQNRFLSYWCNFVVEMIVIVTSD